ncbi:MAG: hypothetical protein E6L03_08000 [Thaumarchaeota archaeon]|nr:MAG: hypothetical protein E6L03_08000 [Nitrososphaerota archaeon]
MNLSSKAILLPAIALLIGAVTSTGFASSAYADDPEDNKVKQDIDLKHTNSCDERGNGDNSADCSFKDNTNVDNINVKGQENHVYQSVDSKHKNDCDERGDGDNKAKCSDDSTLNIGKINID